ncbi:AAA family ATPase [Hymenobacter sp. APR13]|uniref:AAA family ATPase n=1 Tax=Hymenobacter sp. APR13 TaxID=1356852 RepID=UPI000B199ED1|nr:AAA family ATPase [Hymenobacter sp. APR13]
MNPTSTSAASWPIGLVVGKFLPFHAGHQLLLEQAAARVQDLYVLVYSNPDPATMDAETRASWIRQIYTPAGSEPGTPPRIGSTVLHVVALPVGQLPVPPNEADDHSHREFVRRWLRQQPLRPDVVFASEDYGPGFAAHIGAEYVGVDPARTTVPISGTRIREDLYGHNAFLHPVVQAHFHSPQFIRKIVLMGAESTGKSTLSKALAAAYGTVWVHEYGRTLHEEKNGATDFDDLLYIAHRHRELEDEAVPHARHFLFVDTNAATTAQFSYFYYARCAPELMALAAECRQRYFHTFLCAPDIPYEDDGWRDPEALRDFHHGMVAMQLDMLQIPYTLLTGSVEERLQQVYAVLGEPQNVLASALTTDPRKWG